MKDRSHSGLRSAAVFCLCALFAVLAMGLTLLSSGIYRDTARAADENYIHRTALSYLVNQVRRADAAGRVAVGVFGDGAALCLTEQVDGGEEYLTLLYCYDGQLRELYMASDAGLLPADGIPILPMERLSVTLEQDTLHIGAETGGQVYAVSLAPRCTVEEVGDL